MKNDLVGYPEFISVLVDVFRYRGGKKESGSMIWVDPRELIEEGVCLVLFRSSDIHRWIGLAIMRISYIALIAGWHSISIGMMGILIIFVMMNGL